MFVTSDILDLRSESRFWRYEWRENLLCGIDVHGVIWPGYEAVARFLIEAAKRCGFEEMHYAGYNRPGEWRTRPIAPRSFARLAQGGLPGAKDAAGLLFRCEREAEGTHQNAVLLGGQAHSIRSLKGESKPIPLPGPPWRFQVDFVFPIDEYSIDKTKDLFQLAVDILEVEYGYYFVRDAACGSNKYPYGMTGLLGGDAVALNEAQEGRNWADVVAEGLLWSRGGPILRDLFQVNLLSERHRLRPFDGRVDLVTWIEKQPGRGAVQDIGKNRWLWTLTDAEIVAVRSVLSKAGFIFSCHDRVYRDLPDGGRPASATATMPSRP
jgi:hypothetical protein